MNNQLKTWEEAINYGIKALSFDLGQSPNSIKKYFNDNMYLMWNKRFNNWYWVNN